MAARGRSAPGLGVETAPPGHHPRVSLRTAGAPATAGGAPPASPVRTPYADAMRARSGLLVLLLLAAAPGSAGAAPAQETVPTLQGVVGDVAVAGCGTTRAAIRVVGAPPYVATPAVDAFLDGGDLVARGIAIGGGTAAWDVGPHPELCGPDDAETREASDQTFAVASTVRRYVLRVDGRSGKVRSVAGLRTAGYSRRTAPTIRRARAVLGRPSTVRRDGRRAVSCSVRWKGLGLRALFVNLGGYHPCRAGSLQSLVITGPDRWAVAVGGDPAIVETSTPGLLAVESRATPVPDRRRTWQLAEAYSPYGDGGPFASVVARGGAQPTDPIRGYEAWVGAAGD